MSPAWKRRRQRIDRAAGAIGFIALAIFAAIAFHFIDM